MLDRAFFVEQLDGLLAAEANAQGGKTPGVELILRHGVSFRLVGRPEAFEKFLVLTVNHRKERRRVVVPYEAIVAVALGPEDAEKGKPGFLP